MRPRYQKAAIQARVIPVQVVVLDEAGAVGIDDMKRLFDLARMPGGAFG